MPASGFFMSKPKGLALPGIVQSESYLYHPSSLSCHGYPPLSAWVPLNLLPPPGAIFALGFILLVLSILGFILLGFVLSGSSSPASSLMPVATSLMGHGGGGGGDGGAPQAQHFHVPPLYLPFEWTTALFVLRVHRRVSSEKAGLSICWCYMRGSWK